MLVYIGEYYVIHVSFEFNDLNGDQQENIQIVIKTKRLVFPLYRIDFRTVLKSIRYSGNAVLI